MNKETPSRTAYKVALNIITLGAKPGMERVLPAGIVEASERLLIAAGAAWPTGVRWSRKRWMVSLYEAFDWLMPGQFEAFAHRKAFCEQQVRAGIADGASQVLVLGAGYDTLGWRLAPEFRGVNFFEIDHPATARLKAKGIAAMGARANLHLVAEDLGQHRLVDVLAGHPVWEGRAVTVVVAEGLLMYLPPGATKDLLSQCASCTGPGSRLALTYVDTGPDGRPDAGKWGWLVRLLLKSINEPWQWSVRPERLGSFLAETGWQHAPDEPGTTSKHGVEFFGVGLKPPSS